MDNLDSLYRSLIAGEVPNYIVTTLLGPPSEAPLSEFCSPLSPYPYDRFLCNLDIFPFEHELKTYFGVAVLVWIGIGALGLLGSTNNGVFYWYNRTDEELGLVP